MDNIPRVSVIIPTYNRPHLIGRAIQSVLNQTYQDFEVVIIDSSPDDKTQEAVNHFSRKRMISYVHNKQKTNAAASRNQGVKASNPLSRYVAFLDDDDEFFPRFLEKTVAVLEEKKHISMATSDLELRSRDTGELIRVSRGSVYSFEQGISCGCVIRKEIFTKENFWYDERLVMMEDPDLGARVFKNHTWECLREPLWVYYVYPMSNKATLCSEPELKSVELFYQKNYLLFKAMGREALGFLYVRTGKVFLRGGQNKRGRDALLKAVLTYPSPQYALAYAISLLTLFFPGLFQSARLRILKQKILRGNF